MIAGSVQMHRNSGDKALIIREPVTDDDHTLRGDFIFADILAMVAIAHPGMRMTPAEIQASALDSNQIGSSGLPGVHTKVVFGDPSKLGFYTILLFAPAHTTHRDNRWRM